MGRWVMYVSLVLLLNGLNGVLKVKFWGWNGRWRWRWWEYRDEDEE